MKELIMYAKVTIVGIMIIFIMSLLIFGTFILNVLLE